MGKARDGYVTPRLPTIGVTKQSSAERLWQSSLAMILIALLIPFLIGVAAFIFLRRRGNAGVRGRVAEFVSLPNREGEDPARRIFVGTERSLERTEWWGRFKESLEFAEVNIPPVYVAVGTLILTIFAMWLFSLIAPILFLVGLVVPLVVRSIINGRISRKQRLFGEQLPDNLDVVSSALRSGYSLVGALAVVVNNAPEPSRAEFQRVIGDEQLGVPLEDALMRVSIRMKNRDIEQVALVSSLQGETGGNAAEVLDRVTESIRERAELRRLVRVLTAQGRFARWIVSALPITLLLLIWTINPSYIKPLFSHTSGRIALVFAAMMVTAGSVVIGRIVDIEV
jgi:tight adherence protein B